VQFSLVFEHKNHHNREIKNMWFGLIRLTFKKSSKLNQIKQMQVELVRLVWFS